MSSRFRFSHTCFADVSERQAGVLVRHRDHTVGQARSTSIKPISDVVLLPIVYYFFMGKGAPAAHGLLLANDPMNGIAAV